MVCRSNDGRQSFYKKIRQIMHYIKFNDNDLPIKVDFRVNTKTTNKLKISFNDFRGVIHNGDQLLVAFKESLIRGHQLENKPFELTDDDIESALEQNYADYTAIFLEFLVNLHMPKDETKKKFLEQVSNLNWSQKTINEN
jgi:hypothetical protein